MQAYGQYLGGEMCQDIAIYLSCESKFDFADNGKMTNDPTATTSLPHVEGVSTLCKILTENHIPFGVITRKNLNELSQHRIIILSNVLMMDDSEITAFREYVKNGGCLYASNYTSLVNKEGRKRSRKRSNFALTDVFGVSYKGQTKENFTYIAPTEDFSDLFGDYSFRYPIALSSSQMIVSAEKSAKIIGTVVLPWTDPAQPDIFASQHSNPPNVYTDHPSVIFNKFGKGKSIYVTGDLKDPQVQGFFIVNLLKLFEQSFTFTAKAPVAVQMTAFHQIPEKRYILNLVNFQNELPNIAVNDIEIAFNLNDKKCKSVTLLPLMKPIFYSFRDNLVNFTAEHLDTFSMYCIVYK
jgi:hypothetical protein